MNKYSEDLKMKLSVKIFFLIITATTMAFAQDVNVGADIVSRYIWRGLNIADSPSLQPTLNISDSNFEVGFWGAYTLVGDRSYSDEIDAWIGYSYENKLGEFSFTIIDYYFPNAGKKLGNLKNVDGAHTLEGIISYSGPFSLSFGFNFYNDPGNNIYLEIGYPFQINDISVNLFLGATPGSDNNPDYYGTDNLSVINTGVKVSKEIKITEEFALPVFSSLTINPRLSIAYLVFGISL